MPWGLSGAWMGCIRLEKAHSHMDVGAMAHRRLLWGSGMAPALPCPCPVCSPSLPAGWVAQRCPAGSLPRAGWTPDTQQASSSKHPPTGTKDSHCLPQRECLGDTLHRPSGRVLGTRGFAPSHCLVGVPRSHTLPPAPGPALSPCSGPAQRLSTGSEARYLLRKGPRAGAGDTCPRGGQVGGGRTEGQTPAEEADFRAGLAVAGQRGLLRGAGPRRRHPTPAPHGGRLRPSRDRHVVRLTAKGAGARSAQPWPQRQGTWVMCVSPHGHDGDNVAPRKCLPGGP